MTTRSVYVSIRHRMYVDISDELLEAADEGDLEADQAISDLIYEAFIDDTNWYFNDMEIN